MELYNGDCLEVMDNLIAQGVKVDAIITDPPYGMEFKSNYRKVKHEKIENDDNLLWLPSFIEKCNKLLKDNSHLYFFCSYHKIDIFKQEIEKVFNFKSILIWEKNNTGMGDLKGDYASKTEFIIYAHKGYKELKGNRDSNIIKDRKTGNDLHPTQKPVPLMEYFINKSTDKNDIVLDAFMGSGTTGVACKNLDRNFIGIELDKKYFKIAKKRIENHSIQERFI